MGDIPGNSSDNIPGVFDSSLVLVEMTKADVMNIILDLIASNLEIERCLTTARDLFNEYHDLLVHDRDFMITLTKKLYGRRNKVALDWVDTFRIIVTDQDIPEVD